VTAMPNNLLGSHGAARPLRLTPQLKRQLEALQITEHTQRLALVEEWQRCFIENFQPTPDRRGNNTMLGKDIFTFIATAIAAAEEAARVQLQAVAFDGFEVIWAALHGRHAHTTHPPPARARSVDVSDVALAVRAAFDAGMRWARLPKVHTAKRTVAVTVKYNNSRDAFSALTREEREARTSIVREWIDHVGRLLAHSRQLRRNCIISPVREPPVTSASRSQLPTSLPRLAREHVLALRSVERREESTRDAFEEAVLRDLFVLRLRWRSAGNQASLPSPSLPALHGSSKLPPLRNVLSAPRGGDDRHVSIVEPTHHPKSADRIEASQPAATVRMQSLPPLAVREVLRAEESLRAAIMHDAMGWYQSTALKTYTRLRHWLLDGIPAPKAVPAQQKTKDTRTKRLANAHSEAEPANIKAVSERSSAIHGSSAHAEVRYVESGLVDEIAELLRAAEISARTCVVSLEEEERDTLAVKESVWRGGVFSLRRGGEMRLTRRAVTNELRGPRRPRFPSPKRPPHM
jgi:hypothetical protein